MFAPRQQVAAEELVRVTRPGGEIVVAAWTPDGMVGRLFGVTSSFMPPPPEGLQPPVKWGVEDHVRGLFAASGAELEFERRSVAFEGESVQAWIDRDEQILGPALMAKAALEAQGRYEEMRREMVALHEELNEAQDGSFRAQAEYLVTVARKPAA
jgi:hypothetical protein